ncbi:MAG TPA: hypothetical protein VK786_06600, partial [bacterium]|nr:hypothetical protein [bacterium]
LLRKSGIGLLALVVLGAPLRADLPALNQPPAASPPSAQTAADPAMAAAVAQPASPSFNGNNMYVHLGLGSRWFPLTDPNTLYFDPLFEGIAGDSNLGTGVLDFDAAIGYQSPEVIGLEPGFEALPIDTFYGMISARFASPGMGPRPMIHTLGFQVGWSSLSDASSHENYGDYDYDTASGFSSYGVCYRVEQMVSPRVSIGLELAYHVATTSESYTNYTYSGAPDYTTTENVVQQTLNYSGPSIKLVLSRWAVPPFMSAEDEEEQQEIQDRREERMQRRRRRRDTDMDVPEAPEAPDFASADEALAAGDQFMESGLPLQAKTAYQQATLLAPQNGRAWRGLANSEYSLGEDALAYTHYRQALSLRPDDQALRVFVGKLRLKIQSEGNTPP